MGFQLSIIINFEFAIVIMWQARKTQLPELTVPLTKVAIIH